MLGAALWATLLASAARADTTGSWVVGTKESDNAHCAVSSNDSGSILGQICVADEGGESSTSQSNLLGHTDTKTVTKYQHMRQVRAHEIRERMTGHLQAYMRAKEAV